MFNHQRLSQSETSVERFEMHSDKDYLGKSRWGRRLQLMGIVGAFLVVGLLAIVTLVAVNKTMSNTKDIKTELSSYIAEQRKLPVDPTSTMVPKPQPTTSKPKPSTDTQTTATPPLVTTSEPRPQPISTSVPSTVAPTRAPVVECPTNMPEADRLDCHPQLGASEEACIALGCCWNSTRSVSTVAACFFPPSYVGYEVTSIVEGQDRTQVILNRRQPSGLKNDSQTVRVDIVAIDNQRLRILIDDPSATRFEVGLPRLNRSPIKVKTAKLYKVKVTEDGVLKVTRKSTGVVLFDTDLTKLTFSNQFLQLTNRLPSKHIYGLGEHQAPFR